MLQVKSLDSKRCERSCPAVLECPFIDEPYIHSISSSALMVLGEACCIGGTCLINVQEVCARRLGVKQPQ